MPRLNKRQLPLVLKAAVRSCIQCSVLFNSSGPGHRLCNKCRKKIEQPSSKYSQLSAEHLRELREARHRKRAQELASVHIPKEEEQESWLLPKTPADPREVEERRRNRRKRCKEKILLLRDDVDSLLE